MPNILNVQDLNVGYQDRSLLKKLKFSIDVNDFLIVLGANGIGKSSLVKTLLGLIPAQAGTIRFSKKDSLGFMPQLKPKQQHLPMSVKAFLDLFLWEQSWREQVTCLLDLTNFLDEPLEKISYGMWQRVNLAQAVASQPALLILDEPTQGLDIDWQTRCYDFLANYALHQQAGIFCVSHDTVAITQYATKVLCLDHQDAQPLSIKQRALAADQRFIIYQHHHHH